MKCPQGLHDRGSVTHSAVRRVRERHIQHEGGTNMDNVHYVGMDVDKEKMRYNRMLWIGKKRAYPSMLAKAREGVRSNGEDTG